MHITILPTTALPGLQTQQAPEIKERPGADRDHDADDKQVGIQPASAAPKGLGVIFNGKA